MVKGRPAWVMALALLGLGAATGAGIASAAGAGAAGGDPRAEAQARFVAEIEAARAGREAMRPRIDARLAAPAPAAVGRSGSTRQGSVIRACRNRKTGVLRVAKRCRKAEQRMTWSATGPAGSTGQAGAAGVTGATGATGAPGPAGAPAAALVYVDVEPSESVSPGSVTLLMSYRCSRGGTAIGIGFTSSESTVFAYYSAQSGFDADTWVVGWRNVATSGSAASVSPRLLCLL